MPTARRIATPMNSAEDRPEQAGVDLAVAKAGSTTWSVDQPSTQASATVSAPKSRLPMVERVKIHGLAPDRDPEYGEALARRRPARLRLLVRHLVALPPPVPVGPPPVRVFHAANPLPARSRPPDRRRMLARMSRALLARRERDALCDLALVLGEDAPTLCGDWTAKDLVTHLLVREHSPLAAVGLVVRRSRGLTDREMARLARKDFAVLVERLRGHGLDAVLALPPVDGLLNTAGVLRAPRGPPPGPARLGAARARPRRPGRLWWSRSRARPARLVTAAGRAGADPAHRHRRRPRPCGKGADPAVLAGPAVGDRALPVRPGRSPAGSRSTGPDDARRAAASAPTCGI